MLAGLIGLLELLAVLGLCVAAAGAVARSAWPRHPSGFLMLTVGLVTLVVSMLLFALAWSAAPAL